MLEQHADERGLFHRADGIELPAVYPHLARVWPMQTGKGLEEDRLARARASGDAHDFAGKDVESDPIVHLLPAKSVDDAARG